MTFDKILMTIAAAATLASGAGAANAQVHDRDHDGRPNHSYAERHDHDGHDRQDARHDRYWRSEYRGGYIARDRVYVTLREHGYRRWDGDPFWRGGRYVVRSYDRRGHIVFVEVNPYTGGYIGILRF